MSNEQNERTDWEHISLRDCAALFSKEHIGPPAVSPQAFRSWITVWVGGLPMDCMYWVPYLAWVSPPLHFRSHVISPDRGSPYSILHWR